MSKSQINRRYVVEAGDPLHPLLTSLSVGFDPVEPGGVARSPEPCLDTLAFSGTTAGKALLRGDGCEAWHGTRSLMVMFPHSRFRELAGDEPWESHYLVLWGPLAENWVRAANSSLPATALTPVPGTVLDSLEKACRLVVEQPAGWQWPFLRHLTTVLDYAHEQLSARVGGQLSLAAQAQALMARHLSAPLSLAELARRLNVSPSTLSHRFREQTGLSPGLAQRQTRIAAARQLLANGGSVAETSQQLGFANQFHFSRLFRQVEGLPPAEFARAAAREPLRKY
ncbi:MAG: helix-turn-helix transcriptional regulator [candidate division WS1 bacterium]|nr:helix-turn-helix transcriptional regulator [candidate division WS1 bacterium]